VLAGNADPASPGANNPAGLLASIRIFYTDNTNQTIVSDATWQVSGTVPKDFPLPADISQFVPAQAAAKYGAGPWGTGVSLTIPASNSLSLNGSSWIWSTANSAANAPVGSVGFRKTVVTPAGKSAATATVLLSVDNTFQLYVNHEYIGAPPFDNNAVGSTSSWEYAQRFTVNLTASSNIFTVFATNFQSQTGSTGSSAGFIAALLIEYADGSSDTVRTDTTWLAGSTSSAANFLLSADSTLAPSIAQGDFGMSPWGTLGVADALNVMLLPGNNDAAVSAPPPSSAPKPIPASTTSLPAFSPSSAPDSNSAKAGTDTRSVPIFFILSILASYLL